MALKPCIKCGKEVPNQAEACPHCGIKTPRGMFNSSPEPPMLAPKANKAVKAGYLTVSGFFVLLVVTGLITNVASNPSSQSGASNWSASGTSTEVHSTRAASPDASSVAPPAPGSSTTTVFIGNPGVINGTIMACPHQQDLETFETTYHHAAIAQDKLGKTQAIRAALKASCIKLHAGDTGIVIDDSSWKNLDFIDRMQMDRNHTAYWVESSFVSPIRGQPNEPLGGH